MRKSIGVALAGLLAMNGSGALAANCAMPGDMAALRTAALQQELMVAAFNCHAIQQYNRFVLTHRAELIDSDARLKAYFVHTRGGEAGYHTYKTELANASSLRSSRDTEAFCSGAEDDFDLAGDASDLSAALESHGWRGTASFAACTVATRDIAAATPRSQHTLKSEVPAGSEDSARSFTGMSAPGPHHKMESGRL